MSNQNELEQYNEERRQEYNHEEESDDRYRDYIEDGVYIEWDGYAYWLRANDHRDSYCTDKICLEPSVISALNRFVNRMESIKNESPTNV